jgi:hypothetical protein
MGLLHLKGPLPMAYLLIRAQPEGGLPAIEVR